MPKNSSNYEIKVTFDNDAKEIILEDICDYGTLGNTLADMDAECTLTDPAGNQYNVTIDNATSRTQNITPALASGEFINGSYELDVVFKEVAAVVSNINDAVFTLNYTRPTIDISMTVDCISPELTASDDTNYVVNGVTPTFDSRETRLQYPPSTGEADVVGVSDISTNTMYTSSSVQLQHSTTVTVALTYDYSGTTNATSEIYVTDDIVGTTYVDVNCDNNLCDIYCGIRAQYTRWQNAKCNNLSTAESEESKFISIMAIAELVKRALECGEGDHISAYIEKIKEIANISDDCGCDDGTPVLVTGLGGPASGGTTIVQAGSNMTVTSVVVGSDTTYTVALDSASVTKLAGLFNTTLTAGTGINVALVVDGSGNYGYTVSYTGTANITLPSFEYHLINVGPSGLATDASIANSQMNEDGGTDRLTAIAQTTADMNDNNSYTMTITGYSFADDIVEMSVMHVADLTPFPVTYENTKDYEVVVSKSGSGVEFCILRNGNQITYQEIYDDNKQIGLSLTLKNVGTFTT